MGDWSKTIFDHIDEARTFAIREGLSPIPYEAKGYVAFVVRPTRRKYVLIAQRAHGQGPVLEREITRQTFTANTKVTTADGPTWDPDLQRQVGMWCACEFPSVEDALAHYARETRDEAHVVYAGQLIAVAVGDDIYEVMFDEATAKVRVLHRR